MYTKDMPSIEVFLADSLTTRNAAPRASLACLQWRTAWTCNSCWWRCHSHGAMGICVGKPPLYLK